MSEAGPSTVISDQTPACAPEEEKDTFFTPETTRRNMLFCVLLDVIYITGWTDFQMSLQPLMVYLGASKTIIGVVSGFGILQIIGNFSSPWISLRFRIKKWYMFAMNIPAIGAIGVGGIVLVSSRGLELGPHQLLMTVLAVIGGFHFFSGFLALPHQEYVAGCIPMSHRGRLTGYSFAIGGALSLVSALFGRWILKTYPEPISYGYLFLITWAVCQSGYFLALFAREKPTPVERAPRAWSKAMIRAAWNDTRFRRFLVIVPVVGLTYSPVAGFIGVYGFDKIGMAAAAAATFQIITQVIRIGTSSPLGMLVDKIGAKRVMITVPLFAAAALAPCVAMPNPLGIYIATGFIALYGVVQGAAYTALTLGIPKPENRAGHYSILFLLSFIVGPAGSVLAGRCIDVWGYKLVFLATVVIALLCSPLFAYLLRDFESKAEDYA